MRRLAAVRLWGATSHMKKKVITDIKDLELLFNGLEPLT